MAENMPLTHSDCHNCGLSVRDHFALMASDRDVDSFMHLHGDGTKMLVRDRVAARWAYADAMIAAMAAA